MKSIRKCLLTLLCMLAFAGMAAAATVGIFSTFGLPSPGLWKYGTGMGQVTHVRISNALPTAGTVTVSRVSSDRTFTNAVLSLVCVSGMYEADITNGPWFVAGDYILRGGSVTNSSECLLFTTGN